MNKFWRTTISISLALIAGILLAVSLKLPLWKMKMEAPQYKDEEALRVVVFPGAMRGDLHEISVLNQYIGVHVPRELPQLQWLPGALLAAGALGLLAGFFPTRFRKWSLIVVPAALSLALIFAAFQAQKQMHDIGHNRDKHTILARVNDFTPPLLGEVKIFQFEIESKFGIGAFLIGAAILLQFTGAWVNRRCVVASGVSPDVEDGILPSEYAHKLFQRSFIATRIPPGGTPGSTAGGTPAATSKSEAHA